MAAAKMLPFCSRAARCAVGVLASKNFSQFAVISATASALVCADADAERSVTRACLTTSWNC